VELQQAIATPTKEIEPLRDEMQKNSRQLNRIDRQGVRSAATAHTKAGSANIQTANRMAVGICTSEEQQTMHLGFSANSPTKSHCPWVLLSAAVSSQLA